MINPTRGSKDPKSRFFSNRTAQIKYQTLDKLESDCQGTNDNGLNVVLNYLNNTTPAYDMPRVGES